MAGILIALVSNLKHKTQQQESERKMILLFLLFFPFQQNPRCLRISLWVDTDLGVIRQNYRLQSKEVCNLIHVAVYFTILYP